MCDKIPLVILYFFKGNLAAMKRQHITLLLVGNEFEYKDKRV